MSNAKRAHRNREYVRRLLKKKWPEFAAALDQVVWELMRPSGAPSAESAGHGTEHAQGPDLGEPLRGESSSGAADRSLKADA